MHFYTPIMPKSVQRRHPPAETSFVPPSKRPPQCRHRRMVYSMCIYFEVEHGVACKKSVHEKRRNTAGHFGRRKLGVYLLNSELTHGWCPNYPTGIPCLVFQLRLARCLCSSFGPFTVSANEVTSSVTRDQDKRCSTGHKLQLVTTACLL